MSEIKLYKSPWVSVKFMLMCSIFVALGIWGLSTGAISSWAAWLNIGFFGLGYPVGLYQLLDKRPHLVINETGIISRNTGTDAIRWNILQNAYLRGTHKQKFLCLLVSTGNSSSEEQPAGEPNEIPATKELNISLGQVKISPKQLLEFVLQMAKVSVEEKRKLIAKTRAEWNA